MMIKAALFIDFDNFFGGLIDADPVAALDFIERPSRWIAKLRTSNLGEGDERRRLILRCYMNPSGSIEHPRRPGERLYFSRYRPFFTQAGVEVVDCPSLTKAAKNGADIRIVTDVMTALTANTRYDEFVLAAADADFTPLLQVLRADDRRITVIATRALSTAFESLADRVLDEQDVFDLLSPDSSAEDDLKADQQGAEVEDTQSALVPASDMVEVAPGFEAFAKFVRDAYADAGAPLAMAGLSVGVRQTLGMAKTDRLWFGLGSFRRALERLSLPNASFTQHYLWDTSRHSEPLHSSPVQRLPLPSAVAKFAEVAGMPRVASSDWPVIHQTLEAYAALHVFNFLEASKWSRDQVAEQGFSIPRTAFTFTIRACQEGEVNLNDDPSPTAEEISQASFSSILRRAETAGLEVGDLERRELAAWVHHQEPEGEDDSLAEESPIERQSED